MPQFCSLFYAILQSWRPKGGSMPPPKYAPVIQHPTRSKVAILLKRLENSHYYRNLELIASSSYYFRFQESSQLKFKIEL